MRRTEIHLSEPFEEVLASLLTLPSTLAEIDEVRLQAPPIQNCAKAPSATQKLKKPCVLCMKRHTAGTLKRKLALLQSLHRSLVF